MIYLAGCNLAGVDFPYWQTFNLQKVFPGLQNKLSVFPLATIYNQIIKDWISLRPKLSLFKKTDLERQLETLYGAYLLALKEGAAPYELAMRNPKFKTVSFIVEKTKIDRAIVVAFLTTLEKLAKSGAVDMRYWNPERAIQLNKQVQAVHKAIKASAPKSPVASAVQDVAGGLKWGGIGLLALVAGFAVMKVAR